MSVKDLTEEQLDKIMRASMEGDKGYFMGAYIFGYLADAVMLGMIIQLFIRWYSTARKEDMRWVLLFFVHRAWKMTNHSKIFAAVIIFLLLVLMADVLALKIIYARLDQPVNYALMLLQKSSEMAADLVVTLTITTFFMRSKTGWKATDKVISRLLRLVAETQLPPTLMSLAFILGFLPKKGNNPTLTFFTCTPKVYVLCLFIVINSREGIRRRMATTQDYSTGTAHELSSHQRAISGVQIKTEIITESHKFAPGNKKTINRDPLPSHHQDPLPGSGGYDLPSLDYNTIHIPAYRQDADEDGKIKNPQDVLGNNYDEEDRKRLDVLDEKEEGEGEGYEHSLEGKANVSQVGLVDARGGVTGGKDVSP